MYNLIMVSQTLAKPGQTTLLLCHKCKHWVKTVLNYDTFIFIGQYEETDIMHRLKTDQLPRELNSGAPTTEPDSEDECQLHLISY